MSRSADARTRRRQFAPKARTGCKTCKIRHVKCGEEKPHCHKCISTGRSCDGYETIRMAQTSTDSSGEMVLRWAEPPSQLPEINHREQEALYHFREGLLDVVCSTWDMDVWRRIVLPMTTSEPIVRHAVIALGALGTPGDDSNAFGLQQYGSAMKILHSKLANDDKPTRQLILAACLVFVAIEFVQHGWREAQDHLKGGLCIVKEIQHDSTPSRGTSLHKGDLVPLEQLFGRLDNQMSQFTSTRPRLHQAMDNGRMAYLPAEVRLKCIEDAEKLHSLQMAAMRELVHEIERQRFLSPGITAANYVELEVQVGRQLASLDRWHNAMQDFMLELADTRDTRLARLLWMSHLCCKVMVSNALSDGREVYHDRFLPEFDEILTLGAELLRGTVKQSEAQKRFSLDTGIIAPIYYVALKCRDPGLRRQAIALLRSSNSQEGAWDSHTMAILAERVMNVEQRGLDNPQSAADVPEQSRLRRAWYDLTIGDHVLFCMRRAFERNGEWLEYEEIVG